MTCTVAPHTGLHQMGAHSLLEQMLLLKKCCEEVSILYTLSAAFNPEGNGEAERVVQAAKRVISHAGDNLKSIQSCVPNLIYDQRVDGSGSAADLFLQGTTHVPGLAHLPSQPRDVEKLRAARASSRAK